MSARHGQLAAAASCASAAGGGWWWCVCRGWGVSLQLQKECHHVVAYAFRKSERDRGGGGGGVGGGDQC